MTAIALEISVKGDIAGHICFVLDNGRVTVNKNEYGINPQTLLPKENNLGLFERKVIIPKLKKYFNTKKITTSYSI